ncbi:MAG: hypothetical protein KGI60_01200 [Patescibacteria group bacterium]|nr:hypothetical protein [Patescibacteria group bacterium]
MKNTEIVMTLRIADSALQEQLWKIYEQSFAGKEVECAQNQKCYDRDGFLAALTDRDYVKYYLVSDGLVAAYMLSTNNLAKASVTYMNPERYAGLFPDFAPDRIYYCTSLAVAPGMRSQRHFYNLMSCYLENVLVMRKGMHAFDFSHETIPNLPAVLIKIGKRLADEGKLRAPFIYAKVGAQEFGALIPPKTTE